MTTTAKTSATTPRSSPPPSFTAFEDHRCLAAGSLPKVAVAVKERTDEASDYGTLLVFDDRTGSVVDLDLRGTADDVVGRLPPIGDDPTESEDPAKPQKTQKPKNRGPGRPKLGVVGREVTLLPRHWQWLGRQPGGASVTLRKLVEAARNTGGAKERKRLALDAAYHFMSAMAGNYEGFEEASRALFAGDRSKLMRESSSWPEDVRAYTLRLAEDGLGVSEGSDDA